MSCSSILIIDDKADLLDLFAASLRRLPYEIMTAQDGQTALEILQQHVPCLILLDLAMPVLSGFAILHQVRADPKFEATKIMVVTAIPSRVDAEDAVLIDRILPKPVTPHELQLAVSVLLGE